MFPCLAVWGIEYLQGFSFLNSAAMAVFVLCALLALLSW